MTTQAMLELILRQQLTFDFSEESFADLAQKLDLLHDAASVGRAEMLTGLKLGALRGWLQEIDFILRETLFELEGLDSEAIWN